MNSAFILLIAVFFTVLPPGKGLHPDKSIWVSTADVETAMVYEAAGLSGIIGYESFSRAMAGLQELPFDNKSIITIIDFTLPSVKKRLFVVDVRSKKLLYRTYCAHGRNSGDNLVESFSNVMGSYQSSPGFYETGETYQGSNGYSLRLEGLEPGINDHALDRAIVMHGADYVSEEFINRQGRLGRSWGCPVVPKGLTRPIIDCIKGGTCLYIHTNQSEYLQHSLVH